MRVRNETLMNRTYYGEHLTDKIVSKTNNTIDMNFVKFSKTITNFKNGYNG